MQRPAQALQRFLVFQRIAWSRDLPLDFRRGGIAHRLGSAAPGVSLQVLGSIKAYAKNPGTKILDIRERFARSPALQEHLLRDVLGVVVIAQDEEKRADQFGSH